MTEESSKTLDERIDQVEEQLYWQEIDHRAQRREVHDIEAFSQYIFDKINRSHADSLASSQRHWERYGGRDDQRDRFSENLASPLEQCY